MVQQQFIISELGNESENSSEQDSNLDHHTFESDGQIHDPSKEEPRVVENGNREELSVPYSRGFNSNKVSFAIFGTFKHQFVLEDSKYYRQYVTASLSGFRVMGMIKPEFSVIIATFLSCEGFREDASELKNQILHYFAIFEEASEMKLYKNYNDLWCI